MTPVAPDPALRDAARPSITNGVSDAQRREINQALLAMAFRRLRASLRMTVVIGVAYQLLFSSYFPKNATLVWVSLILTVAALRFVSWWAHQRAMRPVESYRFWQSVYTLGALAGAASWVYGPVMVMPQAGHTETMILVVTVLGVGAVTVSTMAAQLVALMGFLLTILVPTIVALVATGGDVERMTAIVLFGSMASLLEASRSSHRRIRSLVSTQQRLSRSVEETDTARARAEAASHAKTRFLANMSHELRSPLNAVIGAAQLMKAGERDPQERAQLVEAIERSGTNLLGLIENILDLSRIEAGELVLVPADFHLVHCLDAALATAGLAARAKQLTLLCSVEPELAPWRHADGVRLRQVLLNLLGNAVKFTETGGIELRVTRGAGPDAVRISVIDTGVGIRQEALAWVFEPFRQADDSAGRRFGGSGLGLAIVRQLVHAMGGEVTARSHPGEGSTFVIDLPLPLANSAAGEIVPCPRPVAGADPHRGITVAGALGPDATDSALRVTHVLVVEDDPLNQTIVSHLLQHAGYQVSSASNGFAALAAVRAQNFDLILMDWQMPDMDGLEVTRRMRAGEAGPAARRVPIVALTANAFAEDRAACLAAGMNDFLTKPVLADSLTATIARWAHARAPAGSADGTTRTLTGVHP